MSVLGNAPPPLQDKVQGEGGLFSDSWQKYISRFPETFDAIPSRLNAVSLSAQGASVGPTDLSPGSLGAGLYRVTWYARITRAATVSSSLQLTLAWTDGGVAVSFAQPATTGNTTASIGTLVLPIRIDAGTAINYTLTYASVGGTSMLFSSDLALEKVKA